MNKVGRRLCCLCGFSFLVKYMVLVMKYFQSSRKVAVLNAQTSSLWVSESSVTIFNKYYLQIYSFPPKKKWRLCVLCVSKEWESVRFFCPIRFSSYSSFTLWCVLTDVYSITAVDNRRGISYNLNCFARAWPRSFA